VKRIGIFSESTALGKPRTRFMTPENAFFLQSHSGFALGPGINWPQSTLLKKWFPHHITLPSEDNGFAQCGKGKFNQRKN
jgi:hypothetical protein